MRGLYLHFPFCQRKCPYCDFLSIRYSEDIVKDYIFALLREIEIYAKYFREIKTVYLGGGTPSLLLEKDLEKIFRSIYDNFYILPNAEITLEANPETLSPFKLRFLKEIGVNRLSIGAQTFEDKLLKILGREHTAEDIVKCLNLAREAGFQNINMDLIFGIPKQSKKKFITDLNFALSLLPEHISIYNLTLGKGTKLGVLNQKGEISLPSEKVNIDMYLSAIKICEDNNLFQYEISNFAQKNKECLHNLSCWNREEYLGLGASAASYLNGARYHNAKNVKDYIKKLKENILPIAEVDLLTEKDNQKERVMLGLRKKEGIKIKDGLVWEKNKFFPEFKKRGLVEIKNSYLKLTPRGMLLSNYVIVNLWENIA